MARRKKTPGIRRKGNRWEVYVRIKGEQVRTSYPLGTPESVMQAWQGQQRTQTQSIARGSFADHVQQYLDTVRHMPTYRERTHHLEWWVNTLGPSRARATIRTTEIDAALSKLKASGKSNTTVRHYRTALLHLFRKLDGKGAHNPVAASWRPHDPPPEPRALAPAVIVAILQAVRSPKPLARLWVMATTGLPHKLLMQLTPSSIDWDGLRVYVPMRRKGGGAAARWLPLSEAGVQAFRALDRAEAWGRFSVSSLRKAWQQALKKLHLDPTFARPYDLRHSLGTVLYRQTGDLATVARLLGHADERTTKRYSLGANSDLDALAMRRAWDDQADDST